MRECRFSQRMWISTLHYLHCVARTSQHPFGHHEDRRLVRTLNSCPDHACSMVLQSSDYAVDKGCAETQCCVFYESVLGGFYFARRSYTKKHWPSILWFLSPRFSAIVLSVSATRRWQVASVERPWAIVATQFEKSGGNGLVSLDWAFPWR